MLPIESACQLSPVATRVIVRDQWLSHFGSRPGMLACLEGFLAPDVPRVPLGSTNGETLGFQGFV